jgi:hypothetical protein
MNFTELLSKINSRITSWYSGSAMLSVIGLISQASNEEAKATR